MLAEQESAKLLSALEIISWPQGPEDTYGSS